MMEKLLQWFGQPTSIAGFSALLGTLSALLTHQITMGQALPLLIGAAASIALPDNTAVKTDLETAARDVLAATKIK